MGGEGGARLRLRGAHEGRGPGQPLPCLPVSVTAFPSPIVQRGLCPGMSLRAPGGRSRGLRVPPFGPSAGPGVGLPVCPVRRPGRPLFSLALPGSLSTCAVAAPVCGCRPVPSRPVCVQIPVGRAGAEHAGKMEAHPQDLPERRETAPNPNPGGLTARALANTGQVGSDRVDLTGKALSVAACGPKPLLKRVSWRKGLCRPMSSSAKRRLWCWGFGTCKGPRVGRGGCGAPWAGGP